MVTKTDEHKSIVELCKAFDDIIYMAIRYSNNRHSTSSGIVRDACAVRAKYHDYCQFYLKDDNTLDGPDLGDDGKLLGVAVPEDNLKDLVEYYKHKKPLGRWQGEK